MNEVEKPPIVQYSWLPIYLYLFVALTFLVPRVKSLHGIKYKNVIVKDGLEPKDYIRAKLQGAKNVFKFFN